MKENGFVAVYWRDMVKFFRSKALLFSALIQPMLWLVLYGISMSSNINIFFPTSSNPQGVTAIAMKVRDHNVSQAIITLLTLPLFFASNALYPLDSLPTAMKIVSYLNPLTHFINGIRYFGISPDFYSFGVHYSIAPNELLISLGFLVGFNVIMFLAAIRAFETVKEF